MTCGNLIRLLVATAQRTVSIVVITTRQPLFFSIFLEKPCQRFWEALSFLYFRWVWPLAFLIIIAEAAAMPLEAVFFNLGIMSLFEGATQGLEVMYPKLDLAVLSLVLVGLGSGLAVLCQNSLFTYIQESLCMVLRQAAFASTVRMDMAFFDAPENQTASILVSLERHMKPGVAVRSCFLPSLQ